MPKKKSWDDEPVECRKCNGAGNRWEDGPTCGSCSGTGVVDAGRYYATYNEYAEAEGLPPEWETDTDPGDESDAARRQQL